MRVLQRFNEFLVTAGSWGTIFFMAVIAIVVPYEVIGRYVFAKMSMWSGEVSTYSLVWASMLGGAVGLKKGYMISMNAVLESVPKNAAKLLKFLSYLCALIFFGAMFGYGLFQTIYNVHQTSPAMGLVMSYPYAALPTGFFIMFFLTMEELLLFLGLGRKEARNDRLHRHLYRAALHLRADHRGPGGLFPGLRPAQRKHAHHDPDPDGLRGPGDLSAPGHSALHAGREPHERGGDHPGPRPLRPPASGPHPGGLGHATILACAIFAAISGAAVATAVAIGVVMIPAMTKAGYDEDVAGALTCTASCMGPIIPPSIPFIIYGVTANVSIGGLFLGGVLPGLVLGAALMIYMYIVAVKRDYPRDAKAPLKEILVATVKAVPALFMPVLILGGILTGMFTPTEAAGVAVVYSFLVGIFLYRRLNFKNLPGVFLKAGLESGMVMMLIAMSEPFAWIVAVDQIPQLLIDWISTLTTSPWLILLFVNLLLLLIGIPMETAPALVIVTPVLAPLAAHLGIDPVHMGIVICLNLVLGLITPPVGAVLFAVCGVTGMSLDRLGRAVWAPFFVSLIVLAIVTYVPWLSTFLPRLFMGR